MNNIQCGISGHVNGIRDLSATYPGSKIGENLGTDTGLGKKTIFGIVADPDLEIRKGGEGGGGAGLRLVQK